MDTSIATTLAGAGVAGVMVILFVMGMIFPRNVVADLKAEIAELKAAVIAERLRADASVQAAATTRDILAAIQAGRGSPP